MYANHRHYTLFIIACVTLVVVSIGYAFLKYKIYAQAVDVVRLSKEVSDMEDKKKREADVTHAHDKLSEQQKLISSYVVRTTEAVTFIEDIEKVGDVTGVSLEITNINTKPAPKTSNIKNNFTKVEARVEVSGSWANVLRALKLIENMPYSITVSQMNLVTAVAGEGPLKADAAANTPKTKVWKLSIDVNALAL